MNRKYVALISVFVIIGLYYALTPSKLHVSAIQIVHATEPSIVRSFEQPNIIAAGMGSYFNKESKKIQYNGFEFVLKEHITNLLKLDATYNGMSFSTYLQTSEFRNDSSALNWFYEFPSTYNPLTRWENYQTGKALQTAMKTLLASLSTHLSQTENIYGFPIKEIMLTDTVLITTRLATTNAPTENEIYQKVAVLEQYIAKNNKHILNNPMITLVNKTEGKHITMIGLSIDGEIPSTNEFAIKLMPPHGKMYITEVTGGQSTIDKAYQSLHNYQVDSKNPMPALPFELLITHRLKVADTSQWKTRIYFPVMKI
jgi:hypothetical protein